MFFWGKVQETALTQAVLEDDRAAVKRMAGMQDKLLEENSLGLNGVDLALYLGRKGCLEALLPHQRKRAIKVLPPGAAAPLVLDCQGFEQFFQVAYLGHLEFADYEVLQSAVKKCPKRLKSYSEEKVIEHVLELGQAEARIGSSRGQEEEFYVALARRFGQQIREGYFADVLIKWIDPVLEYGLFAGRPLRAGTLIGEYIGVVRACSLFSTPDNAYLLHYPPATFSWRKFVTDSMQKGNEMRFTNHSFAPNMALNVAVDKGVMHALYFANRNIREGEQLTWNYGEDYWERRDPPQEI